MDDLTQKLQSLLDGFGNRNNGRIERKHDGFYYTSKAMSTHLDSEYHNAIAILKQLFI
ncbi:hypothetical protein Cl131_gp068 [Aphanizomenon phage vB_AphaS-CL131]|nr:hypothetical protein Cl131_gp068 [Aphanizomenon phage vB_AphaS-CL131]